jgi:aminoglycoside phosphotransferase family enzyme/predicted kinase
MDRQRPLRTNRESELVAALADPSTYDATTPVAVHETHASWVFVVGARAYKLKKPVALGFLDYSTPALRRSVCIAEVAVNQELAPDIYLGVRAIVRANGGFAFASEDDTPEAVDYVVEMRSFDAADTLAGVIASGALSCAHVDAVAARLAAFQRTAPVVSGGGAAQELDAWRKNVCELARVSEPGGSGLGLFESFAETFVHAHARELEQRQAGGLVRDGHGDLRCEHVLVRPTVRMVDRIEFDPSLRHADIACDLAFLAMDLESCGQREAAERLVSAYRREGMDAGSNALLSFYGAHRALVRAKVALIAAAEQTGERAGALNTQAGSLLALAERLCWRARAPLAIVVCGPAASGKSTLAAELSRRCGFTVLSSDETRKAAAGVKLTDRARPEHYSHSFTHHTYELLAAEACALVDAGGGVIVDATCRSRVERSTLLGRLARTGAARLVVRCEVPLDVALRRAGARIDDLTRVSDADPQIVAEQYHSFQALEELPPEDVLGLDTQMALDAQAASVMHAVDRLLLSHR